MAEKNILRIRAVMARTGMARSSIYQKMNAGEFPPSINIGSRSIGWLDDEIEGWIDHRTDVSRRGDSE